MSGDRWYEQSIVASCDRPFEQSWHPVTDGTNNRGILCAIVRALVASCDRAYNQSWHPKTDGTINRVVQLSIVRSIEAPHDLESQVRSFEYDHRPCYDSFCTGDHPRPLRPDVRSFYDLPTIPKKNRLHGFRSFEHGHDLAATDFAQAITHDLCDQSYVLSMICHDSNIFRSQVGRNLVESGWLLP